MKLKALTLSALAAVAILISTGASANGYYHNTSPSLYIGWNSNGNVSYGLTFGQPQVVVVPSHRHHVVRRAPPQRHWRPVVRHCRADRRGRGHSHYCRPAPRRAHHH